MSGLLVDGRGGPKCELFADGENMPRLRFVAPQIGLACFCLAIPLRYAE